MNQVHHKDCVIIHDRQGNWLKSWETPSNQPRWHHIAVTKNCIYETADKCGGMFIYNHKGEPMNNVSFRSWPQGVVCLPEETLVVTTSAASTDHLVSIDNRDSSVKEVLTWGRREWDVLGWMYTIAVYKDLVAIGGDRGICVYKVLPP